MRNLSSKENVSARKISGKNKLFIDKDRDYHSSQPALDNPDVDWPEFEADYSSRMFYAGLSLRLAALTKSMTETQRLHDHDNFQNALLDYQFAKYKDRTSKGLSFDSKVEELGQFFKGGGSTMPDSSEE